MLKLIPALLGLSLFACVSAASAETVRILVCENTKARIEIGICGIAKCPVDVIVNGATTSYLMTRKKKDTGALTYNTRANASRRCTIVIGPLDKGARRVQNASCARDAKGSACQFVETEL